MVRLNKNKLSDKYVNTLSDQLSHIIAQLNKDQTSLFLHDLLGYEERVMLSKRLAIVVMLLEGYSMYKISKTLKVSPTTVEKTKKALDEGAFSELIYVLKKDTVGYKAILEVVDSILTAGGVIPYYGQARL